MLAKVAVAVIATAWSLWAAAPAQAQLVPLVGNHPDFPQIASWPPAPPERVLDMQLEFRLRNQADLRRFSERQQDPSSPDYRRAMSKEEVMERFAPTREDFDRAVEWLSENGFEIVEAKHDRISYVKFKGTVQQVQEAFRTQIVQSPAGRYANLTDPFIPAALEEVISGILGLDDISVVSAPDFQSGTSPVAFGVADVRTFYSVKPLLDANIDGAVVLPGKTQQECIAITSDSDFLNEAVDTFNMAFGLPQLVAGQNLTKVFASNDVNPGRNEDQTETLIDIEWAHALAPGAPIRAYIGNKALPNQQGAVDAIARAVDDNACAAITVTVDFCTNSTQFFTNTLGSRFAMAAVPNLQAVLVSSGDKGSAGRKVVIDASGNPQCITGTEQNAKESAASPDVAAVGGTQVSDANKAKIFDGGPDAKRFVPEEVWNDSTGASGGGTSRIFARPSYQTGPGVPTGTMRLLPDIAVLAGSPNYFVGVDDAGTGKLDCCFGGTSFGPPIWAGLSMLMIDRAAKRVGNINPQLYKLGGTAWSSGLRDVISGNNSFNGVSGFTATQAYDRASAGEPRTLRLSSMRSFRREVRFSAV